MARSFQEGGSSFSSKMKTDPALIHHDRRRLPGSVRGRSAVVHAGYPDSDEHCGGTAAGPGARNLNFRATQLSTWARVRGISPGPRFGSEPKYQENASAVARRPRRRRATVTWGTETCTVTVTAPDLL